MCVNIEILVNCFVWLLLNFIESVIKLKLLLNLKLFLNQSTSLDRFFFFLNLVSFNNCWYNTNCGFTYICVCIIANSSDFARSFVILVLILHLLLLSFLQFFIFLSSFFKPMNYDYVNKHKFSLCVIVCATYLMITNNMK